MTAAADALVLFGISGDLARKKLFSALYGLAAAARLDMPVVGVAASDWDDAVLRAAARESLEETGEEIDEAAFTRGATRSWIHRSSSHGRVDGGLCRPTLTGPVGCRARYRPCG